MSSSSSMAHFFKHLLLLCLIYSTNAASPRTIIINPVWTPGTNDNKELNWQVTQTTPGEAAQQPQSTFLANAADAQQQQQPAGLAAAQPAVNIFLGEWKLDKDNAGVSAMHMQVMPNNKVVWFDSTDNGLSEIQSVPRVCKPRSGGAPTDPAQDCTAHAIEYDPETGVIRPLQITNNPWCSSGGLSKEGALVSTGGTFGGFKSMRILRTCPNCNFEERKDALFTLRWYSTQVKLQDGGFAVVGGSHAQNIEFIPDESLIFKPKMFPMPFLDQTHTVPGENNLYPFVNLLPDGNLWIFANDQSIILDPKTGNELQRFPVLPGGTRNYPPSACSALLPIDLTKTNDATQVTLEVIICGGNSKDAFLKADRTNPREFTPALKSCGRITISPIGKAWDLEDMPSPRVMGDMHVLPTGDLLMINGAQAGTSAWNAADIPNLTPVLYKPNGEKGNRFKELVPTTIPRMYHSSSAVLPDGHILVAGSNTNEWYMREAPPDILNKEWKYPTDLRVEKFAPPYFAPELQRFRVEILENGSDKKWAYKGNFNLQVRLVGEPINPANVKVTMYSPPFTTHGYSQNQRLLILQTTQVTAAGQIKVVAPPSGTIAPPGYYLIFVVHNDVPSRGMWVQIL